MFPTVHRSNCKTSVESLPFLSARLSIERIPPEETLHSLLEAGELDAILPSPYPGMASQLNRTDELRFQRSPKIKRLFQDAKDEAISYFRQTSLLPINHTIIIKNSILEAHAGVAMSLYRAFQEAKALTYERLNYLRRSSLIFSGLSLEEERELFGDDPYPYGLEANRCVLETLIDYSHEQENSSRRTLFLLEPRTTVRNMRLLPRR